MPPKSTSRRTPCSICHKVAEELKFHYDICEPCHLDFVGEPGEEDDLDYSDDDDSVMEEDVELPSDDDINDHPGAPLLRRENTRKEESPERHPEQH